MDLLDGCIKQMQLFESLLLANALEVNDAQLAANVRKSITGLARLADTVQLVAALLTCLVLLR